MKKLGPSLNKSQLMGRIVGSPVFANGWVTAVFRTEVPEPGEGGKWNPVTIDVPIMTNDVKRVKTFQDYIADERQLYLEGYNKYWINEQNVQQSAVVVTLIKLMSKTMYDESANNANPGIPGLQN